MNEQQEATSAAAFKVASKQTRMPVSTLPPEGMSRASTLLPLLPFGSTTLWQWSKNGKFPAPVKVSNTITAWRNRDVLNWLEHWHPDESEINNSVNNKVDDGC